MNRFRWQVLTLVVCAVSVLLAVPGAAIAQGDHAFVGADKCMMCHKSEAKGNQYGKWQEARHSKAFATLGGDEAKKIAAEKGIEDPQKADACLSCHVTGHGADATLLTSKYKIEDGVGCESCHGAGSDYWKMSVMKDKEQSIAGGMVVPNEATCLKCHNDKSPTFKGFDFEASLAKISHPNPKKAAE